MFITLFLSIQVLSLYTIFLVIIERNKTASRKYLISIIIIMAMSQILPFLTYVLSQEKLIITEILPIRHWVLVIGPGIYLYAKSIIGEKIKRLDFIHLLPFLIWWLIFIAFFFLHIRMKWIPEIYGFFCVFSLLGYGIFLLFKISKHTVCLREQYSYSDIFLEIKWLYYIALILISVTICVAIGINILFYIHPKPEEELVRFVGDPDFINIFHALFVLIFLFFFSLLAQKQERHSFNLVVNKRLYLTNNNTENIIPEAITETKKDYPKENKKFKELIDYMKCSKIYLENKLSLQDLSEKTNINRHELSRIINESTGDNFFHFINSFRAEEFMDSIKNNRYPNFNLLGIAQECGFNSKATFNNTIKREFSKTPSQIFKEIRSTL